jgi:hypothetical protein
MNGMKTKAAGGANSSKTKNVAKKDIAASYNQYKFFEGQQYTGMKIGRSHKWYYDKGEWKDYKITPDLWEIEYQVTKRRAGKAPEGSGVPVGTQYHWYILAHQHVKKLDANSYSTTLTGLKYKLAHKRFDTAKWNISDAAQRKRLIKLLKEITDGLEKHWVDSREEILPQTKSVAVKKIPVPAKKKSLPERKKRSAAMV